MKNATFRLSNYKSKRSYKSKGLFIGILLAAATGGLIAGGAAAQPPAEIEEVVVKGVRFSLDRALDIKREASGVVDGIVAEDIADFPDLNIGEALQRITGVTLDRNDNGEGNRISVRGLPSDFVRTTLNGITAASSATDGANAVRAFDFNLFASELFSRVTVVKSGQANLAEGGIAATVNLQTPRPFDLAPRTALVSATGQYAELAGSGQDVDPRIALLASDVWRDGQLGAAVSLAWSDTVTRGDLAQRFRFQNTGSAFLNNTLNGRDRRAGTADDLTQADLDRLGTTVNGAPATLAQLRDIAAGSVTDSLPRVGPNVLDRKRLGLTTALQFKPTDTLLLSADLLYARFDDIGYRATIDGLTGFARRGVAPLELGVQTVNGQQVLSSALLDNITQRTESVEDRFETDFMHLTLDSDWQVGERWNVFTKLGWSRSEGDELRRTYLYQHSGPFRFDLTASPDYPLLGGPQFDYLNPADYVDGGFRYRPRNREDEERSVQVDFTHSLDSAGALADIEFGFRYSDKAVSQRRGELRGRLNTFAALTGSGFGNGTAFADISAPVTSIAEGFLPGAPAGTPRNFLIIRPDAGAAILPRSLSSQIAGDPLSSWTVSEKTAAAYLRTLWKPAWGGVDVGLRIVRSEQTSSGSQSAGGVIEPVRVDNNYTDVLPSFNVRFDLHADFVMRFSANRAITRPTLGQLSPGTSIFPTLLSARGGNPQLDPFRATQYDLSFEWYFAPESLLSAALFYKDINSFIVNSTTDEVITGTNLIDDDGNNVSGSTFRVTRPANGKGGELTGLELSYQQPFGDSGFGMLLNATLSDSEGTFIVGGAEVRGSLSGQSDLSWNLIGYYEKHAFSARLAYSHRGDFAVGGLRAAGRFVRDERNQIDLSASYAINDQLSLSVDALNISGEDSRRFSEAGLVSRFSEQGAIYVLGLRYRL